VQRIGWRKHEVISLHDLAESGYLVNVMNYYCTVGVETGQRSRERILLLWGKSRKHRRGSASENPDCPYSSSSEIE
jgi:hypothetical protein